jgi:hypothetical protein
MARERADTMTAKSALRALPRGVWALGFVSLFMDTASELIHSLLPVFLVPVLGASMTSVGVIEGLAEAAALITRVFSGAISDYLGRRKLLTVIGYGVAALTKPLFPLAGSVATVLAARLIDRVARRKRARRAAVGPLWAGRNVHGRRGLRDQASQTQRPRRTDERVIERHQKCGPSRSGLLERSVQPGRCRRRGGPLHG